jgi:hypothetical protein
LEGKAANKNPYQFWPKSSKNKVLNIQLDATF